MIISGSLLRTGSIRGLSRSLRALSTGGSEWPSSGGKEDDPSNKVSSWGDNLWGTPPQAETIAPVVGEEKLGEVAAAAADVVTSTGLSGLEPLSTSNPGHVVMQLIEKIHVVGDLPYWQAIMALTIVLRICVLPIGIKAMKDGAKMQILRPEMEAIRAEMMSDPFAQVKQQEYEARMRALFAKYQVTPFSMMLGPLAQMPIFLAMFFGIRQMGDYFPGFATGGDYWFHNLSVADPQYILPVANSVMFVSLIELGGETGTDVAQTQQQKLMKNVFRAMGIAMVPLTMHMPAGLFVYWCTNISLSVVQNFTLKNEAVRRAAGIPKVPVNATSAAQTPAGGASGAPHKGGVQEAEIVEDVSEEARAKAATTMDVEGVQKDKSPFMKLYEENQRLIEENKRLLREESERRGDRKN